VTIAFDLPYFEVFMKKMMIFGFISLVLSGCSGVHKSGGVTASVIDSGVGIQWNDHYVVTVGNLTPGGTKPEYECSGCDLQFVRHASSHTPAQWRDVVDDESLEIKVVQVDQAGSRIILYKGHDADISVGQGSRNQIRVARMGDVDAIPGSPLHGADGKVIGMHVEMLKLRVMDGFVFDEGGVYQGVLEGDYVQAIEGKLLDYSVYLPYALIREQWAIFQSRRFSVAMLD
jgi:hypothetical protein